MDKIKVRFTETRVVDDHRRGTALEERYEEGKTYPLEPRSADRWVKRGAAEYVDAAGNSAAAGVASDVGNKLSDETRSKPDGSRTPTTSGEPGATRTGGPAGEPAPIPDDWRDFNAEDTKALAVRLGAGDDVKTKAQALEFIEAELARRDAA